MHDLKEDFNIYQWDEVWLDHDFQSNYHICPLSTFTIVPRMVNNYWTQNPFF